MGEGYVLKMTRRKRKVSEPRQVVPEKAKGKERGWKGKDIRISLLGLLYKDV